MENEVWDCDPTFTPDPNDLTQHLARVEYLISPLTADEVRTLRADGFSEKEIFQIGNVVANGIELEVACMVMEMIV